MSPVAVGVPEVWVGEATGLPNEVWIDEMRLEMSDPPFWQPDSIDTDASLGTLQPGSAPLLLSQPPVWERSNVRVSWVPNGGGAATVYAVIDDPNAVLGVHDVYIDRRGGQLIFSTAPPAAGKIVCNFEIVKWTDERILLGLHSAVKNLNLHGFQKVHIFDKLQLQVLKYLYQLPSWASAPTSKILNVEYKSIDIPTEDYHTLDGWHLLGTDQLNIDERVVNLLAPTAVLRVTGVGPYEGLQDLDPELFTIVKLYAKAQLYLDQAGRRAWEDRIQPAKLDAANPADMYRLLAREAFNQYTQEIKEIKRRSSTRSGFRLRYRGGRH